MKRDSDDRIIESWKDNAGNWTQVLRDHALESRRLITDQAVVNAVLNCGGSRILDVGCGEGWLSRSLADAGRDVTGFDACSDLIQQAQVSGAAKFLLLSYEQFAHEPERVGHDYDVSVCNFSLLTEDLAPVLKALRKVSKPSGHLLIQTIHPPMLTAGLRYEDGWREETFEGLPGQWSPMPWYFRTISSWIKALKSTGWQIDECVEPLHPVTGNPASLILQAVKS